MTHAEAIAEFKSVKAGDVVLHVGRRVNKKKRDSLTLPPVVPTTCQQVKWKRRWISWLLYIPREHVTFSAQQHAAWNATANTEVSTFKRTIACVTQMLPVCNMSFIIAGNNKSETALNSCRKTSSGCSATVGCFLTTLPVLWSYKRVFKDRSLVDPFTSIGSLILSLDHFSSWWSDANGLIREFSFMRFSSFKIPTLISGLTLVLRQKCFDSREIIWWFQRSQG